MSVASKNPFALLDDDATEEVATTAPAAPAPVAPPVEPKPARDQKTRGGPASRGGKYYQRGGAKNVAKDAAEQDQQDSAPRESRRGAEGEVRGRGRGGRGGARGGGRGRGRGREFDRHSGTFADTDKKVNQGWGANEGNAEFIAEEQAVADVVQDTTGWGADLNTTDAPAGDGWGATEDDVKAADNTTAATPANGNTAESRRPNNREEEEDNSLTLDEYLAKKADQSSVPKLESVRKANEGADESLWKDVVQLSKDEEDHYFVGKTKNAPKARPKKEEKVIIEIDAHFERPRGGGGRGRGGRGGDRDRGERGRGGGRGRGNGGPPRGGGGRDNSQQQQQAVNVEDQTAFPSLS